MKVIYITALSFMLFNCNNNQELTIESINLKEQKRIMENERLNAIQFFKMNNFEDLSDSTFLEEIKSHSLRSINVSRLLLEKHQGFHQQYYRDHLLFNDSEQAIDLLTEEGEAGMGQLEGEHENLIVRVKIMHCKNNIFCTNIINCKEGLFYRNIVLYDRENRRKKIKFDYCDVLELNDGKLQVINAENM